MSTWVYALTIFVAFTIGFMTCAMLTLGQRDDDRRGR